MADYIESEVKLYVRDLAGIEQRLNQAGATLKAARVYERNVRYENAAHSLTEAGIVIRLRQDTRIRLTYKDKKVVEDGVTKRFEAEVEVNDFDAMEMILGKMGYEPNVVYEKYRTTYLLDGAEVVLDEMPYGHFVEIEGDKDTIERVIDVLDLKSAKRYHESYLELAARVQNKLGLQAADLTFANYARVHVDETDFDQ